MCGSLMSHFNNDSNNYSVKHENKLYVLMITLSKHFIPVMARHPSLIRVLWLLQRSYAGKQNLTFFFLYKSLQHMQCTSDASLFLWKLSHVIKSNVFTFQMFRRPCGGNMVDVTSPCMGARCCWVGSLGWCPCSTRSQKTFNSSNNFHLK